MSAALTSAQRAAIARRLADGLARLDRHCDEWFPEQRAFYDDDAPLVAALCSRRAGKTRGGCPAMLRRAVRTPGRNFLYINETRPEARRLAWNGNAGDGMRALAVRLGLDCELNEASMTIRIVRDRARPDQDTWIYLLGADDEAGVAKALGGAYAEVWWDEAQKISPRLTETIRKVLLPALLDHNGRLRLTGTPSRQMSGLFYDVTRTDGLALKGWSVHRWNGLANPHFGRVTWDAVHQRWLVVNKMGAAEGAFSNRDDALAAAARLRYRDFVLDLQRLFGGAEVAPVDGPLMQREAFGKWVHEDAAYTYAVNKVPRHRLAYAPSRWTDIVVPVSRVRGDEHGRDVLVAEPYAFARFPDLAAAFEDLPGRGTNRGMWRTTIGADIGYNDPFAWVLWAWREDMRPLYEVASWRRSGLDAAVQAAVLRYVTAAVRDLGYSMIGIVADAGGSNLPTVRGWSEEWATRYQLVLEEADKANKPTAIGLMNADIVAGAVLFREDGPLLDEASKVQWILRPSGRFVEDPSIPNDTSDAGLYGHRRSYAHRYDTSPPPPAGQAAEEAKILSDLEALVDEQLVPSEEARDPWW